MTISWQAYLTRVGGIGSAEYNNAIDEFEGGLLSRPLNEVFQDYLNQGVFDDLLNELERLSTDPATGLYREVVINGQVLDIESFFFGEGINLTNGFNADWFRAHGFQDIQDVAFIHFARNLMNDPDITYADVVRGGYQNFTWVNQSGTAFHRYNENGFTNNENNFKITTADGEEYIFRYLNGQFELVTDPRNAGSFNFINDDGDLNLLDPESLGHNALDIRPWTVFGNAIDDVSLIADRGLTDGVSGNLPPRLPEDFFIGNGNDNFIVGDNEHRWLLEGGAGNDTLVGGSQHDTLNGGTGNDTVSYVNSNSGVAVNLEQGFAHGGDASRDNDPDEHEQLINIENVVGSSYGDILVGSSGENEIYGGGGNDLIFGEDANDLLVGGGGNDIHVGGAGEDTARFSGNCSEYIITDLGNGSISVRHFSVQAGSANDGTDTITEVETLEFADQSLTVADIQFDQNNRFVCPSVQDVAILIDISGSMGDDIDRVKAEAETLIDSILSASPDSRVSIITYNTIGEIYTVLSFTNDRATALAGLNSVNVSDGGIEPVYGAMISAMQGDAGAFRLDEGIARRIVNFTDEPPGDPSREAEMLALAADLGITPPTNSNAMAALALANSAPATVEISTVLLSGGTDAQTIATYENISDQTGGVLIPLQDDTSAVDALVQIVSTQVIFNGTPNDDSITGNVGDNLIDAGDGNDFVAPSLGVDEITLGAGNDTLSGSLDDLENDTVTDFSEEDIVEVTGTEFDRSDLYITNGSAILGVDTDDDGTPDGSATLEGDFSGGDFMAVASGGNTYITYETFLPTLSETIAIDAADLNGVNNQLFLTGDGTHDFRVTLDPAAVAGNNNTLGVYEVDAAGNIVNVRILVADIHANPSAAVDITGVGAGNQLGFFIVQDGASWANGLAATDALSFINGSASANVADGASAMLAVNGTAASVTVFHSFDIGLNSDGVQHVLSGVNAGGESIIMGFEDLTGGGDNDYQDVLFNVERFVQPQTVDQSATTSDQTIATGAGDDTITSGTGNDTITAGDGNDVIDAGGGNDTVNIGDGDDVVNAGAGNDVIIAGQSGGNDFIDGGIGDDTVEYPSLSASAPVNIDLQAIDRSSNADVASILTSTNVNLAATTAVGIATITGPNPNTDVLLSIENATGGAGNDTIGGSDVANVLNGGSAGDDILNGLAGDDILRGGTGNDTMDGGADHDTLEGGAGDDSINGGTGYDTLVLQGNRDDYTWVTNGDGTYTVTDTVAGRDGTDTIRSVEQIAFADVKVGTWTVAGTNQINGTSASETLTGTDGRDRFYGLAGDDYLDGLGEEDQFIGGQGNDTFEGGSATDDDANFIWDIVDYFNDAQDGIDNGLSVSGVTVNLATGTATDPFGDTDTLIDIERIFGTNLGDNITGSDDNDAFDPFGGNDTVDGGAGYDQLMYHLADHHGGRSLSNGDTVGISVLFSDTTEGSGTVLDDSYGNTDTFMGIEVIRATELNDSLIGGVGHQQFRGYAGDDTMDGGAGETDFLNYADAANYNGNGSVNIDLSVVDANGFTTVVDPFGDTDLIKNFEWIRGTGGDDTILGDGADNNFNGRAGDDILGGAGGNDTLFGDLGNDSLTGGAGADDLDGSSGQDTLVGGAEDDFLTGGADADQFVFNLGDGNDTVEDFAVGEDILVLNDGMTITSVTEVDLGGEPGLDTLVTLSSGQTIELWDVTGVTDPNDLLTM